MSAISLVVKLYVAALSLKTLTFTSGAGATRVFLMLYIPGTLLSFSSTLSVILLSLSKSWPFISITTGAPAWNADLNILSCIIYSICAPPKSSGSS